MKTNDIETELLMSEVEGLRRSVEELTRLVQTYCRACLEHRHDEAARKERSRYEQ